MTIYTIGNRLSFEKQRIIKAETATTEVEVETPPAQSGGQAEQKDEFVTQLSKIYQRLKYSKKLKSAMKEVEQDLLGVLAQRLMRTLCPKCKEPYKPDQKELDHLIDTYGRDTIEADMPDYDFNNIELMGVNPEGCVDCGGTGYKGRTGIHELLVGTPTLQGMIYKKAELDDIRAQALKDGMRTMRQDGIYKIFGGFTDYAQLLRVVSE
ncbi:MAG TPA: hypothetical protein DD672_04030 [Gammaproteobacteria bacterium]|nr:hypothetical protein [Gammaproteobacteria bacterium]HCL72627.1 hypothetical protein [Gammaproteobacteria bacterium]